MSVLADAALLARKDLVVELRAGHALSSAAALAVITLVLVGLSVGPALEPLRVVAPALTWVAVLYAAIALADRLERVDRADDAFTGLWLLIADRRAIYLGRVLSLTPILAALQLTIWLATVVLLDLDVGPLALTLIPLSVLAASAASTATALVLALVADAAHRPLLMPVVLLPLLVPTFLAGVRGSAAVLAGDPAAFGWAMLLAIEAALFLGLGLLTYETAARTE